MLFEHSSYRTYLKTLLAEKTKANPAFSLRAMAKQLGFSSSTLSEVINGKANFSIGSARKLAQKLKLNTDETEYLTLLVQLESIKDLDLKSALIDRLSSFRPKRHKIKDLQVDHFKQIAEWYHSAILELPFIKNFEFTPLNIAKKLGISKIDAELAIERLERLGLLQKTKEGQYVRASQDILVRSPETNSAFKNFYSQMLEKIQIALEEQNPKERLSGFQTIPFDQKALPEIQEALEDFFARITEISKKYPKPDHVYHFAAHFFNLTPKGKGE